MLVERPVLWSRGPFFFDFVGPVLVLGALAVIVLFVVAGITGEADTVAERRGRWLPLVYYYLATVVGLAIVLTGTIGGLQGLVRAAFPSTAPEVIYSEPPFDPEGTPRRESKAAEAEREREATEQARLAGFADAVRGGVTALVGAPVFFWHLRQARRKEPEWLDAPAG